VPINPSSAPVPVNILSSYTSRSVSLLQRSTSSESSLSATNLQGNRIANCAMSPLPPLLPLQPPDDPLFVGRAPRLNTSPLPNQKDSNYLRLQTGALPLPIVTDIEAHTSTDSEAYNSTIRDDAASCNTSNVFRSPTRSQEFPSASSTTPLLRALPPPCTPPPSTSRQPPREDSEMSPLSADTEPHVHLSMYGNADAHARMTPSEFTSEPSHGHSAHETRIRRSATDISTYDATSPQYERAAVRASLRNNNNTDGAKRTKRAYPVHREPWTDHQARILLACFTQMTREGYRREWNVICSLLRKTNAQVRACPSSVHRHDTILAKLLYVFCSQLIEIVKYENTGLVKSSWDRVRLRVAGDKLREDQVT